MICPNCNASAISFWRFFLVGWIHIRCSHCSTRLTLRAVGERFWMTLAAGAVIVGAIEFFVDYTHQWLGEKWALALFVSMILLTLLSSAYFAWKDSRFDVSGHRNH